MITGIIRDSAKAKNIIEACQYLATSLIKELTFVFINNQNSFEIIENTLNTHNKYQIFNINNISETKEFCEEKEVSFLLIQSESTQTNAIKKDLLACRELRIPYILFKNEFTLTSISKVILPVNFLEEEVEKAQFASAFGRFCDARIHVLQAKDYGTKAATNVRRMLELFEKFELNTEVEIAKNDSFKVDKEAITLAETNNSQIVIVSSSREYGLDDLIFGPKELKLQKMTKVPMLLVNPRGDLYALCD